MKISYIVNPKVKKEILVDIVDLRGDFLNQAHIHEVALASKSLAMKLLLFLLNQKNQLFVDTLFGLVVNLDKLIPYESMISGNHKQINYLVNFNKQVLITQVESIRKNLNSKKMSTVASELNLFCVTLYNIYKTLNLTSQFHHMTQLIQAPIPSPAPRIEPFNLPELTTRISWLNICKNTVRKMMNWMFRIFKKRV